MSRRKNDLSQRLEAVIKTLVPQQEQNPDDLGPMMRAIKAVHSISDHTSTTPEDLERQRAAEEVMENLYKLLRFKKSQQSITEYGGHTTDEVRKMFQKKREERTILA